MKTKHLILVCLGILMNISCDVTNGVSNDVESVVGKFEENLNLKEKTKTLEITKESRGTNLDGTFGSVRKLSPYDNVVEISWTLGKYCHFKSLDIKVTAPVNNRWTLHEDPFINRYVHTIVYTGQYEFYLRYYEEGNPNYPMKTDRELALGRVSVDKISTTDPVLPTSCKHDYSRISFTYYEIAEDGRSVVFGGINCTDNYKLVLSSPNIRYFEVVKDIYPLTGLQNVVFALDTPDLYNLKVFSKECSVGYEKCEDYRVIQFSTAVPHMGQVPIQSFN